MNDIERQELWVKLQTRLADAKDAEAVAYATGGRVSEILDEVGVASAAVAALKESMDIRSALAKIESIGDVGGK